MGNINLEKDNLNAISLKNVTKKYKNFTLDDITLDLPKGSIMGLIGENGAGKSTLIKMIIGSIRQKTAGQITVLGESNVDNFYNIRQDIGIVPDEIAFPERFKVKHVKKLMSLTYKNWSNDTFDSFVKRLEIPTDKKFKEYSLGMKKKLGIAVALSHNPKLLILDEATSGLDPVVRDDFLDILYDYTRNEEHSILFSSHIVTDLEKLCDYIAVLHKGKLLMCDEKDTLIDNYRMLRCSEEELKKIPKEDILGKRESPYGVQAVVKRESIPSASDFGNITIEDLFVYMIKGGKV